MLLRRISQACPGIQVSRVVLRKLRRGSELAKLIHELINVLCEYMPGIHGRIVNNLTTVELENKQPALLGVAYERRWEGRRNWCRGVGVGVDVGLGVRVSVAAGVGDGGTGFGCAMEAGIPAFAGMTGGGARGGGGVGLVGVGDGGTGLVGAMEAGIPAFAGMTGVGAWGDGE